jgi:RNA polymerase sigma-70 factor (ECF subfamily)
VTSLDDRERNDAKVIEASVRDPEEFGALYDRHADKLFRFAYQRLGPEFAEDAVADAYLAAFSRRATYDLTRPDARPWLFGILIREIAQRRRAEAARYRALARAGAVEVAESQADDLADGVAAVVTAHGTRAALAEALRHLPAIDRDVVLLIAWNAFSYEEVAEALGIKLGTVRSRLHRARRKLRAALGNKNPIDMIEVNQ